MNWVDAIILVVVVLVLAAIVYFSFIRKNKNTQCKGCAYAKQCEEAKKKVSYNSEKSSTDIEDETSVSTK